MMLLLNPRVWAAIILAIALGIATRFVYTKGAESVQVKFDMYKNQQISDALNAEKAVRAKELSLQEANQKVSENYESLKSATAVVVKSLDADRVRLQSILASRNSSPSGVTQTSTAANDPPESRILGECLQRYESVAGDADGLSNQVKALQDFVNTIH
jgi:hypothetical protein